jgi:hypothetical protein
MKYWSMRCDDAGDLANFAVLDRMQGIKRGSGGVICTYDRLLTLKGEDKAIPVSYI